MPKLGAMVLTNHFKRKHGILAVALLVLFVPAYVFVARPMLRVMGATTYGPLSSHSKNIVLDDGESLLSNLPPLSALSDDSLRFVAMPSFGDRWMALSLSKTDDRVSGQLVVLDRETGSVSKRALQMDQAAFGHLTKRWDAQTDNYWGSLRMFTDGTPLGFERKRGSMTISGIGNSPCHYDVLGNFAAIFVGPHAEELLDLTVPDIDERLASDHC